MSTTYYRIRNWLIDHVGWIKLAIVALAIVFLSFEIGFIMGHESNPAPIIIEKQADQNP